MKRKSTFWGYTNCLLFVVASSLTTASLQADEKRTNVILIMADDIGYECYGTVGGVGFRTPNLDRMATHGTRFRHAYSNPICTPSRVSIMTGLAGVRNYTSFGILNKNQRTFGHMMQEAGYKTAIAGKWQLYGATDAEKNAKSEYKRFIQGKGMLPENAGFDRHALWQVTARGKRYFMPTIRIDGVDTEFEKDAFGPDICAQFLMDRMEEFHKAGDPFFIYYPMILPHSPTDPTPDNLETYNAYADNDEGKLMKYQDQVAYMDKIIGRIVAKTEKLGIAENTLILMCGDNGKSTAVTSFVIENGKARKVPGQKGSPPDGGTRVGLFAYQPGTVPAGVITDDMVDFTDMLPTIAEAAGIEPLSPTDGISFHPRLRGEDGKARDFAFVYHCKSPAKGKRQMRFVRDQKWKLYGDGRLYDVENDVFEESELAGDEYADIRKQLENALARYPSKGQALYKFD